MSTSFESEEVRPPVSSETADNALAVAQEAVAEETGAQRSVVGSMLLPFKVRNFSLFFGGQIISTAGDALYAVALPWLILNNGGSAQNLSIVLTAYSISRVSSVLLGGWLSDRLRPRRIMLIADTIRSVLVALLAALALGGHPGLLVLCAIAVPLGAFGGLFLPASSAILPDILNDENLQAGNALNFSSIQAATLVGSALAGVTVAALSSSAALAIDALTFVISAISLAMMRAVKLTATSKSGTTAHTQTGLVYAAEEDEHPERLLSFGRFLRTSRLIQVAFLISIAANFCVGGLMEVALPTLAHGPMHAGAGGYGAILAGFGAGALVGGICAGMLSDIPKKGLSALLICLVQGLTIIFLPYGGVFGAIALMLVAGISNSITNVLLTTLIQLVIPRHLMGRVMGLLMFASFGSYPISLALAGILTNAFGPAILFPFGGATLILAIFLGIAQKELREL